MTEALSGMVQVCLSHHQFNTCQNMFKIFKGFLANILCSCFSTLDFAFELARAMALFDFTRTDTDDSDDPLLALYHSYIGV